MANDNFVLGLDIGTTKTCAMIGEPNERGQVEIIGVGICPSNGLRKGVVVNIEATVQSIRTAVEAAEVMSGHEVRLCWPGIGGNHIEGINSRGVVGVTGRNKDNKNLKEIAQSDIDRVIDAAKAVAIPMDRRILQVIPQTFIVDEQKGIRDPLNMIGVRLEAEVHLVTCSVTSEQNLIKCVNGAKLVVNEVVLQTLAAGRAALTPEEMEMGVALIDLGGGTTDILVYSEGVPFSNASIPVGSALITSDISKMKSVSYDIAEKLKIEDGCCWEGVMDTDTDIPVPGVGGRPPMLIPRSQILAIIRPRMEEIFMMVKEKLDKVYYTRSLGAGVVLTGGGALLAGAAELAASIFKAPVRIGLPLPVAGLAGEYRSPVFSTAIGLLLLGFEREQQAYIPSSSESDIHLPRPAREKRERKPSSEPSIIAKFFEWLGNDFV
ncbi:MAG: cell division protein FtsA [Treponema sp.]|jgi:cell division protein FtsA|nr:cell division protein FtsA [Treponema sp.]